ncbi:MAG TPA: bacillithiol transferase BstA [Terriglobales bacterium]|nr:bacillithiol transferase BstA [Terriglobales bacterium]
MSEDLHYPVGKFFHAGPLTDHQRQECIRQIDATPASLRSAVAGLSDSQLDTPYRPGGWTVRQVVHHVPDSHLNSYTRFRLALTEDQPTIRTYDEKQWAELSDAKSAPVEVSLALLEALHYRWVLLLKSITPAQWGRKLLHPQLGAIDLDHLLALYAWHGRHHVAHITGLRERMGWQS